MKTLTKTIAVTLAMTLFAIVGPLQSASAWLKICNDTSETITFANTWYDSAACSTGANYCSDWKKDGWYNIAPDACSTVYSGSAYGRYFYYYAQATDGSPKWTSNQWQWKHTSSAHNQCLPSYYYDWDDYEYCAGDVNFYNPGVTDYKHRQLNVGNYTNYTLTLIN